MRLTGILGFFLVAQLVHTQSCQSPQTSSPPSTTPSPVPVDEVFVTRDGVRFRAEVVISRLEIPWSMAFAPDGRLFLTERPGRVRIFDATARTTDVAVTLDDVYAQGEAGVLGLALDPDFAQNRRVYLYYSAVASGGRAVNRVVRYREVGGRLGERSVLLDNIPAGEIHDGGRLRFGPDGLLYVTVGDAANEGLPQDVTSLAGKILRITTDGLTPRANPFGSPIYSVGHRNPQGIDWHPVTGDLWESEHGATGNDEINVVDAGMNYGWPVIQGNQTMAGMAGPIAFFNPAIAPSGASFYRGQRFPGFVNDLFVATLRGTHLLRVHLDSTPRRIAFQEQLLTGRFGRLRDVVPGPDGYLYISTSNRDGRGDPDSTDDRIFRLVPAQ